MVRSKNKKATSKSNKTDSDLVEIVEKEIEFICPVRGRIKQKVKVKKLKPVKVNQHEVVGTSDAAEAIDAIDSGLDIYAESEEGAE